MNIKVDVIIPTHNGARWVKDTIDSVQRQSLKPNRIIVVNSNSSDNTQSILDTIEGIQVVQSDGHSGASARNKGFLYSDAPYVAFLDHDDAWHPDHLKILCRVAEENPGVSLIASDMCIFRDGDLPCHDVTDTEYVFVDPWEMYPALRIRPNPSLAIFKRSTLREIPWASEHGGISDYHMFMQTTVAAPYIRVKAKTVAYRVHTTSEYVAITNNVPEYVSRWVRVADDLLAVKLSSLSSRDASGHFKNRNWQLHILQELLPSAFITDAHNNELLTELRQLFENESRDYTQVFIDELVEYIHNDYMANPDMLDIHRFFGQMKASLGGGDVGIMQILQGSIARHSKGISFYARHYIVRPWHAARMRTLLTACAAVYGRICFGFKKGC